MTRFDMAYGAGVAIPERAWIDIRPTPRPRKYWHRPWRKWEIANRKRAQRDMKAIRLRVNASKRRIEVSGLPKQISYNARVEA